MTRADVERPDWVVPNAAVVTYRYGRHGRYEHVHQGVIGRVAAKSFLVDERKPGQPLVRFPIDSLRVHGGGSFGWTTYVVPADSDQARAALECARRDRLMQRARTAVDAWSRDGSREKRLVAIEALSAVEDDV
jgi:hypothetical protein